MSQNANTAQDFQARSAEPVDLCKLSALCSIAASNDDRAVYGSIDLALTAMVGGSAAPARSCKCDSSLKCWVVRTSCSASKVGGVRGSRS